MTATWREVGGNLKPFVTDERGREVEAVWAPQPGSQEAFLSCPLYEVIYVGTRGPGKMLRDDEPILTPSGWVSHGEVQPGRKVCTPDGSTSTVTHVFRHEDRECFRVTFDDGAEVVAGDEHLWKFKVVGQRRKSFDHNWHWNDTLEMQRHLSAGRSVLIPTLKDVQLKKHPRLGGWPVEPYMLGLHLGDGHFGGRRNAAVGLTSVDPEIQAYCMNRGYTLRDEKHLGLNKRDDTHGIRSGLIKLGLKGHRSWEKFVPRQYMFAPREVRLALLQGLMDTDGTCDKNGYCVYSSSSRQLSEDVQWIVRSLGGKATLTKKETFLNGAQHRDAWTLYIQPGNKFCPFQLARKASRIKGYMHTELCRRVVSIEPVGRHSATCIRIDHPDHLYITRDFIVTHNTDALLMDFGQHVGLGFGPEWRGIIFRQTYPQLSDIVAKTRKWFPKIWPEASFNEQKMTWKWPAGEELLLRHMSKPEDYYNYHGHAYPFIGWEELTTWSDDKCYRLMMSCSRSPRPGIPRKYRATTNPYGVGHNWVKSRFRIRTRTYPDIIGDEVVEHDDKGEELPHRIAIHGFLCENQVLLHADPGYEQKIVAAARNPAELAAWRDGSWDIVAGGMFDDIWSPSRHVVPVFEIPKSWQIRRSFDWGSSKPFSVGWWAISDGTDATIKGERRSTVSGDLFRIGEWYGWCGQPNEGLRMTAREIALGIREREQRMFSGRSVAPGPADSSIYDKVNNVSIAEDMQAVGVYWEAADKSPGSRKQGWQKIRSMMKEAARDRREEPGFFVFETCDQFIRTVPVLPRSSRDPDDADTEAEDHIADECRYMVLTRVQRLGVTQIAGR